jgi:hypothetical protein
MKSKLFSSILLLSVLQCSEEIVFSYAPTESSVVLQKTDVLGATFQNEVTQDQADINRVAVGGRFLTDFFEPFLQLNRALDAFNKAKAHVLSRTEYFDVNEGAPAWVTALEAFTLGEQEENFQHTIKYMYKYMDRTLDETSRGHIAKSLYNMLKSGGSTYEGNVEIRRLDGDGPWKNEDERPFSDKTIYALESLLGCQQIREDGEAIIVEVMHGSLEKNLLELKDQLEAAASGETIVWKIEESSEEAVPGGGDTNDEETATTLATAAMQKGILSEIARLAEEIEVLATLAGRVNSRALLNLFNKDGVPTNISESLITMMQQNHREFENDMKNFIATFLNRIEKTVDYLVPLVEKIGHYVN